MAVTLNAEMRDEVNVDSDADVDVDDRSCC